MGGEKEREGKRKGKKLRDREREGKMKGGVREESTG